MVRNDLGTNCLEANKMLHVKHENKPPHGQEEVVKIITKDDGRTSALYYKLIYVSLYKICSSM